MGMYVPPCVKKKGAYGADQTEKVGAFRGERTVKVVGTHSLGSKVICRCSGFTLQTSRLSALRFLRDSHSSCSRMPVILPRKYNFLLKCSGVSQALRRGTKTCTYDNRRQRVIWGNVALAMCVCP